MSRLACPDCGREVDAKPGAREGRCSRCRPRPTQTRRQPREREAWEEADDAEYRDRRRAARAGRASRPENRPAAV